MTEGPTARDLILVGPARSGTTLACSLLNKVANTVALDEPYQRADLPPLSPAGFLDYIAADFSRQRAMILGEGQAVSTVGSDGLANHYDPAGGDTGLRRRIVDTGRIGVDKPVDKGLRLIVKHTIPFMGVLDGLVQRFPVYALVRHPLAVLCSWNSIDAAYREGRVPPYVTGLTGDLDDRMAAIEDRLERQIALLSWHFERFRSLLPAERVLRYEDIVASGGASLAAIVPDAAALAEPLESRNASKLYDRDNLDALTDALMAAPEPMWTYYSKNSVEDLYIAFSSQC